MNFNQLNNERKTFMNINKNKDHVVLIGKNNVLISAPHGVSQVRLGKFKFSEVGSLATAMFLHQNSESYFIAKTKNNNDDANFDECSHYKTSIEKLIKENKIKYIIDIHGLSAKRDCDINLGTYLGNNIKTDEETFNKLHCSLVKNGFITNIDQPFMAGSKTISSTMVNKYPNLWALQIEINCSITNKKENFKKYKKLLLILKEWINSIPNDLNK